MAIYLSTSLSIRRHDLSLVRRQVLGDELKKNPTTEFFLVDLTQ